MSLDALAPKALSSWFQTRFPSAPKWRSWIHLQAILSERFPKHIQQLPFRAHGLWARRGVPRRESRRCATRCLHSDGGNERRDHDRCKSRAEMVRLCVSFFGFPPILFCKRFWKGEGNHTGLPQLNRHLHYTAMRILNRIFIIICIHIYIYIMICECFDIWF